MVATSTSVIGKYFHFRFISCGYLCMHNALSFTRLWVEGLFLCSCKKLVAARKQMSILQAPNVLVIQLKVGDRKSVV